MNKKLLLHYWVNQRINYSLRIFLSLTFVVIPCWLFGYYQAINPLVLGVIAAAIAEKDDNFTGRIKALIITLVCFTITTFFTVLLFDYKILFAIGLAFSTFSFTMLGAMGTRYTTIGFASILISIYTMLSYGHTDNFAMQPLWLISGALGYGLISLVWLVLWPTQYIQHSLSQLYNALGQYLGQVSEHYHCSDADDVHLAMVKDAKENANVVNVLNNAKLALMKQIGTGKTEEQNQLFLQLYFIAEEIHERASALNSPTLGFKQHFFHSDIIFRLRHLLDLQSKACQNIAKKLLLSENYTHDLKHTLAIADLKKSIAFLKAQPLSFTQASQIDASFENIDKIEQQFLQIDKFDHQHEQEEQFSDPDALHFKDAIAKIRSQMNANSLLFRHAVRLSIALSTGYVLIQTLNINFGFWVLLTILLVSQTNYFATRNKLNQRIIGTFIGLLIGAPLLAIFPDLHSQLVLMITFGMLFFTFLPSSYIASTIFITLLVLMSFNQGGNAYAVIMPRMLDTLIGCFITVVSIRYILPNWQVHRMRGIMADSIAANQNYFNQIMVQFRLGKKNTFAFRQARRDAHNKDAALTEAINNMLKEPGRYQDFVKESFRFLYLNHNTLSHISNLGSLRQQINDNKLYSILNKKHQGLFTDFEEVKNQLLNQQLDDSINHKINLDGLLTVNPAHVNENRIIQQLNAIEENLPEMLSLAEYLTSKALKTSKA